MEFKEYQSKACGTFKPRTGLTAKQAEILDWTVGLAGEVGEVSELIKHAVFHNEPLDKMKLAKELGDVIWYISAICETVEIDLGGCAELNVAKLAHRHGEKFSFDRSANRHAREAKFEDTITYKDIERKVLRIEGESDE